MSLLSALYTGVSGLQTFGDSLQVIGDNIANVNTTAYKSSRAEFADVLSQTINVSSGRSQLGRGVTLERISSNFAQGSFSNTDRMTDLGINGNGFFIVQDDNGNEYFTRNGQLTLDKNGELVTSGGMSLVGYKLDSTGNQLEVLSIQDKLSQPRPTGDGTAANGAGITMNVNLDARASIMSTFQTAAPAATSNFSSSITVYDSQGTSHAVDIYFNKTANNSWDWHALVDGAEVGGTPGTFVEGATGTMTFDNNGQLASSTTTSSSFNFLGTPQTIGFNFQDANGNASTQFSSANVVNTQIQDGYSSGSLTSVKIDEEGIIYGGYSNGETVAIGQIALANFANTQGLHKSGSGLYSMTSESGVAIPNRPNTGGLGTISSYSLELSNVDLATEFVNLISTQRAYQANSKVITVGDDLLSEVVNIIR